MSAIKGVFGALLGLPNAALKYCLAASTIGCVALSFYQEGGSYLDASLNISIVFLLFGLLLAPNPTFISGSSPFLLLLGHAGAKSLALVLWVFGLCLLKLGTPQDTIFLREGSTICMAASLALILPVTRLEAMGRDQLATPDTCLGTSDMVVPVGHSNQRGSRPTSSTRHWQKFTTAWFAMASVGFLFMLARINTSADWVPAGPMIVNDTFIVNDTIIVNNTRLFPLEVPAKANLTMPWTTITTPDFIATLGTPCRVTPTPAPPSPVAKSTWVAAAMSTTMPTPEPTPTAVPGVEPDLELEPQSEPETVAAPRDSFGAFKLMVELFITDAKAILSPPVESAQAWYLSLRVEDRCAAVPLAFVLAWFLLSRLVAFVSTISAPAILPLTCLPSIGLFFCLQHFGLARDLSLFICVALCLLSIVLLLAAAFLAPLLKKLNLLGSHAAEVPQVKADVSRVKADVSRVTDDIAGAQKKLGEFIKVTEAWTTANDQRFMKFSGLIQGALAFLFLIIGSMGKRLTAVEAFGRQFRSQMNSVHQRLGQIESSKASSKLVEDLKRAIEDITARFDELKNTPEDDEARRKLKGELDELSARVDKLFESLGLRIDGIATQLREHITKILQSFGLLTTRVDGIENELREKITQKDQKIAELHTGLAEQKADNAKMRNEFDEHKAATEERLLKLENKGPSDGQVTKDDVEKVQGDVETLGNDAEKDRAENKKAINELRDESNRRLDESDEGRRAEQATHESNARFQSIDDKIDRLQNDFNSQIADTNKRVEEVSEQVDTVKNDSSNDSTPPTLHPDVVRHFETFVKLQVTRQQQALFGGSQDLPSILPLVFFILHRIMTIGGGGPFGLWAAHTTTGTGRQHGRPFTGPPPVPPAAGSGGRFRYQSSGADLMFNVNLIGHIWQSCRRESPLWPNVLDIPNLDRFLIQFIGNRMPRSLTPPNCLNLLSDVGEADRSDHAEVEPGDEEPDGGGAAEDSQQDRGSNNTPDAPQEPSSGGQAEEPGAEPSNSSPPADNTGDEHEPSGSPQQSPPEGSQAQPGAAGPDGVEADPRARSDPSTPSEWSNNFPQGSAMGGHPQAPGADNQGAASPGGVDAPRDTHSDPPPTTNGSNDFPHGSGTGDHSQGSDGTAPGSSSSEAEGSSDNTSNGDNNSTGNKGGHVRPTRTQEELDACAERQDKRKAYQGFPIHHPTGAVTDPGKPGDGPVACVLREGQWIDISHAGNQVDCNFRDGKIRANVNGKNLVVAKIWLPGESEYIKWLGEDTGYKQWLRRNDPPPHSQNNNSRGRGNNARSQGNNRGGWGNNRGGRGNNRRDAGSFSSSNNRGGGQASSRGSGWVNHGRGQSRGGRGRGRGGQY